jgi:hypothetical protein
VATRRAVVRQDGCVRYETAVRRVRTVVDQCQRASGLWKSEPFLVGVYAFGAVLERCADVPVVQMAFVLDLPADELTWCAQPQSCVGLPSLLEIDKAPVEWYWRPSVWPVANHLIHRPLRVWSLDGPDTDALDALDRGEAEGLRMLAPTEAQWQEQLTAELAASLAHLRRVEAGFWERDWRSAHRGLGVYPENHLWDAVHGYLDLLSAAQTGQRDTHT